MTNVRLQNVSKRFDRVNAVDGVDLEIASGELFFLLGPSGCGKSTLLRLIAGLYEASTGKVFFNDRDVTNLPTDKRNAVMCFQSYALWPHMSVEENIRFGVVVRKLSRAEQNQRIAEVLGLVQLSGLEQRKPNELSGGQQQRVALARALAVRPACLLLDEPLSNLDAKLRNEMRGEIRRICRTLGLTTIYVTHDQKEALSIADRIAVMDRGKIAQLGTPSQLYHKPVNRFVAEFIGQTNLLEGRVTEQERGVVSLDTPIGRILAISEAQLPERVTVSIRPEQMRVLRKASSTQVNGRNRIVGKPVETTFLGEASEHVLVVNGHQLKVMSVPPLFDVPAQMSAEFDPEDVVVLKE